MISLEFTEATILTYGNLALGLGTFTLAVVLGITNWYSSKLNRKVHIANKRQDWIAEFRINLSELIAIQTMLVMTKTEMKSIQEVNQVMEKLNIYSSRLRLMFYFNQSQTKQFLDVLGKISDDINTMDTDSFIINQNELQKFGREVIRLQANKIVKLDSSKPLI